MTKVEFWPVGFIAVVVCLIWLTTLTTLAIVSYAGIKIAKTADAIDGAASSVKNAAGAPLRFLKG
jgi:hypothetical protein